MCPSPASYKCSGDGPSDGAGSDAESGNGCGLSLCSTCAVKLVTEHKGKLDALIQEMKAQDDGLGVRADVEMMHSAGELLRRMSNNRDARDDLIQTRQVSVGRGEDTSGQQEKAEEAHGGGEEGGTGSGS